MNHFLEALNRLGMQVFSFFWVQKRLKHTSWHTDAIPLPGGMEFETTNDDPLITYEWGWAYSVLYRYPIALGIGIWISALVLWFMGQNPVAYLGWWLLAPLILIPTPLILWQKFFIRVLPTEIWIRVGPGGGRHYFEGTFFHLPPFTRAVRIRYADRELEAKAVVPVLHWKQQLGDADPPITDMTISFRCQYHVGVKDNECAKDVEQRYFDNYLDDDVTTDDDLNRIETEILDPIIRSFAHSAADGAIQALYADGIYQPTILNQRNVLNVYFMRELALWLKTAGIILSYLTVEDVTSTYTEERKRAGAASAKSLADQEVFRQEAAANVIRSEQRNLEEKARQTADRLVLQREQTVEKQRIKQAQLSGQTAVQHELVELEMLETNQHAVRIKRFARADGSLTDAGVAILMEEVGDNPYAKAVIGAAGAIAAGFNQRDQNTDT